MRAWLVLAIALVLGACAHVPAKRAGEPSAIAAMSFNIRLDIASDGANAWPNRKAMVADVIRREGPALLGLQEVLLHQKQELEAALPEYAFAGVGRDDGADKGEFSPLGWRRDRFDLLQSGTFWLSPTPAIPGKAWDAAFPRIATWALLRERGGKGRIAVLNTHFDHVGNEAKANSAAIIADWAARRVAAGDSVVVIGDFNSTPGSPPMTILADHSRSGLRLARTSSVDPPYGPPGTFTAFKIENAPAEPIDHVLVSDDFIVGRFATITQHWGGRLPSDHYPVVAELQPR